MTISGPNQIADHIAACAIVATFTRPARVHDLLETGTVLSEPAENVALVGDGLNDEVVVERLGRRQNPVRETPSGRSSAVVVSDQQVEFAAVRFVPVQVELPLQILKQTVKRITFAVDPPVEVPRVLEVAVLVKVTKFVLQIQVDVGHR